MRSLTLRRPLERPRDSANGITPFELRLPASGSELRSARDSVADAAAAFGLPPRDRYQFVYAVNEALTNAIKHGSPDQDGTIGLRVEFDGDSIVCSVSDCGPWENPEIRPGPNTGEGGRGLLLMSALADEVQVSVEPEATTVRLRKHRDPEAIGASA
jgi:anti-sigma regulatory factor (Ser/Thr protein kinase)